MNAAVPICLLLACGPVAAQPEKPTAAPVPEIFTVASIAYRDFVNQLKGWEQKWLAGGRSESEMQRYMSDILNYDTNLFSYDGTVHVTFTLRPFRGTQSFGGVTRYVLEKKTGAILEHTGEK